ncbi:MAG TPA: SgcJ/EcaC family oxidoreductase [Terriglobales bacterium]|nr:SgcJ/EcaC family oxidoreductase [Terriglobales bacterium]
MRRRNAIVIAVLVSICGVGATSGRDKGADLVQRNFAAWNAHDAEKVASLYADDVIYEDVAFGLTARGHAEMRKMAAGFFASVPDFKLELVRHTSMGDHGSVEWVFSGTDVGLYKTGKRFSVRGASVYELRGGKFVSNRDYYDSASIMRQVGVLANTGQ